MIPFKAFIEAGHSDADKRAAIAMAPVFISQPQSKVIEAYEEETYLFKAGDSLHTFAAERQIPLVQLMAWNNLNQLVSDQDQKIKIFVGQPLGNNPMNLELKPIEPIRSASLLENNLPLRQHQEESIYEKELERFLFQNEYLFYWTSKREKLSAIASKLPGISLDELLVLNELKKDKVIKQDEKLKIKKLSR
jgi:LysM repeat protein